MNWLLVLVAGTAVVAGPVLAGVVAPAFLTDVAQQGLAVNHRHFVFNEAFDLEANGKEWHVLLHDADLYEMPLSSQAILRGAVYPPPSDEELREAFQRIGQRYHLPILSYDVERVGDDITVKATLPAGILANISPQYRALVEKYEA